MGLYNLLSETVKKYPDNLAMICGDEQCNYELLKELVDKLALNMKAIGLGKDDKIAMISKNCHRFLEAYFAAARLGAVLVPINYRLAPKDFVYILNNSKSRALIAQPELISWISERRKDIPMVENIIVTGPQETQEKGYLEYEPLPDGVGFEEENHKHVEDSEIAQIYYTSGTTGKPKGVILTHKNNNVHAEGTIVELGLSQDDRWLHVSPMFHLADSWAVWSITKVGGTHVIVPSFEPKIVFEAIEYHKVTLSNFIPTMLNILVNFPGVESHDFSSLRLIMSGGAPIAKEVVRKVINIFGCDYIQTYGLTETSPFLTMSILKDEMKDLPFEEKLRYMVTTGRSFYNVKLKVVKDDGREVIPNEEDVGEIIVCGDTITPYYWELPEVTKDRIKDGWLYTRDLAVMNPEGYVIIVDRKDDMIITGGENVYSIEVEDVLYSHPWVLEAAVIGLPDPVWGEKVTAIVVLKEGKEENEKEIIDFCKENLAHFKAPKNVIFTDQIPKTGSAKIYKYRLRERYGKEKNE
ncbi:MAG: long-chain-fatty-acid--CoA ligase [Thermoplasmata archaeon]|nr:MAG: long-chain-fatty-acid--CoA ligase [Thermoplasmata archaeon]